MHLTRRSLLGATAVGLTFAAAGCQPGASGGGLNAVLDALATNILRESPEFATSLAVSEAQAGGPYQSRLSDQSQEGRSRYRAVLQEGLTQLQAIDRSSLSETDAVTYDVVTTSLTNDIAVMGVERGNGAIAPYVVTQLSGSYTQGPDFMASQHPVTDRANADAYIARLQAYAGMLDQETARIGADSAAGFTPPDFAIDKALVQLRAFAGTAPAETVLVAAFDRRLGAIEGFAAADRSALTAQAEQIVRDAVLPAYQRQIEALVAVRPQAVHDAGVWRLPDGEALYATSLRANTTTELTPDEIHQMGVDLVRQFNSESDALLRAQGLTRGTVAQRVQEVSRRPDQLYPNTAAGREQLLADLNTQMAVVSARMSEVCGVAARAPLEIRRVPEYTEAGAPGGYYNVPALDGSRPGAYYINLRPSVENGRELPYLMEWPKLALPTLTYHEGTPGHHWQLAIQQETPGAPFIRSALMFFGAFIEGWGLYAEQIAADDLNLYADNPLGRLGYLQSMTFRASRLVVDTGMHAKRWSREQAIQSMMEATGDQESSVATEIERYCVWPGQATCYMVGRQAINRMRDEAETALGDRFDIRGFHDTLLTNGSTPLTVTEQLVRAWTASVGSA